MHHNHTITIAFLSPDDSEMMMTIIYITLYVLYIHSICISIAVLLFYSLHACLKTKSTLFHCIYLYVCYRHTLVKNSKEEEDEECLLCLHPITNNVILKKCCYIKLHLFCLFQYLQRCDQCPICHLPII